MWNIGKTFNGAEVDEDGAEKYAEMGIMTKDLSLDYCCL